MSNFSARFIRSTLGRLNEKYDWQDLTILISPVRNNFKQQLSKNLVFSALLVGPAAYWPKQPNCGPSGPLSRVPMWVVMASASMA